MGPANFPSDSVMNQLKDDDPAYLHVPLCELHKRSKEKHSKIALKLKIKF